MAQVWRLFQWKVWDSCTGQQLKAGVDNGQHTLRKFGPGLKEIMFPFERFFFFSRASSFCCSIGVEFVSSALGVEWHILVHGMPHEMFFSGAW